MHFSEESFRKIARHPEARMWMYSFREAIKEPGDILKITLADSKEFEIEREHLTQCLKWLDEEEAAENRLIESINPSLRNWVLSNRGKMVNILKESAKKDVPHWPGIQVSWPNAIPDMVPREIVFDFIKKYSY